MSLLIPPRFQKVAFEQEHFAAIRVSAVGATGKERTRTQVLVSPNFHFLTWQNTNLSAINFPEKKLIGPRRLGP